jgi:hypothetical protein
MAKIMINVGALVSKQIDAFAHKECKNYPKNKLE